MNHFKITLRSILIVCTALSLSSVGRSEIAMNVYKNIPDGNASLGKLAFKKYRCFDCHQFSDMYTESESVSNIKGPAIAFTNEDNMSIATAIINPSHSIAPGYGKGSPEDEQISPMTNFKNQMTVQELIDLVAYLKSEKRKSL
ncbi:MAG: sulfur-oxidizing protein SoxX [Candidatus Omnitrophota bacterium]|jgi:sulfur-oxidizing protein SoxX